MGVPQVGQAPQQISGLPQAGALSDLTGSAPDTAPTYDPTIRPLPNLQDAPVGALGTAPDVMSQQLGAPAPQVDALTQPQGLAEFGGRTLSQYLTDPTVEGAGLMTDAQGRMLPNAPDGTPMPREEAFPKFEQQADLREQRLDTMLADRAAARQAQRGGEGEAMSFAEARKVTDPQRPNETKSQYNDRIRQTQAMAGQEQDGLTAYQKETLARQDRAFQTAQDNINREWEASQAAKAEEKAQGIAETREGIQKETERLDSQLGFLEKAGMEMAGLSDWTTEGMVGWFNSKIPANTKKKQVDRIANSFMGNAFLRSIIDSKSLGATFGALSNQEGEKITGAETILMDPEQSNEDRLRAASQIIGTIRSAKARAQKRLAATYPEGQPSEGGGATATPQMEGFTFKIKN